MELQKANLIYRIGITGFRKDVYKKFWMCIIDIRYNLRENLFSGFVTGRIRKWNPIFIIIIQKKIYRKC